MSRFPDARFLKPLAAWTAAIFALSAPALRANTIVVSNCLDAGVGSLRAAAASAVNNDTIDMTGLSCSTISLHTGAIALTQNNVTLNGPGQNNLVISGKYNNNRQNDHVLKHSGSGTLTLNNLGVGKGYLNGSGHQPGACIYSAASVKLNHVNVFACDAITTGGGRAQGGGVYAKNALTIKYSSIQANTAQAPNGGSGAYGGGIYAFGNVAMKYSTISGNSATGRGFGGGMLAYANLSLLGSTVSGNTAATSGGGIYNHHFLNNNTLTTSVQNSTISGNDAGFYTGGMEVNVGTVNISNSSIVFNTATKGRFGASYPFTYRAPGLSTNDTYAPIAVTLQSSLIANNTYGTTEYDLSVRKRAATTVTFSGANNLVRATFAAVPAGTIKISCPLLGPLRDNGGWTQTRALLSHSPGIDQGNNSANQSFDQRGSPYARVDNGVADIGAYEVQQADIVFNSNFEGCPTLF